MAESTPLTENTTIGGAEPTPGDESVTPARSPRRRRLIRLFVVVAAAFTVWHVLATFLWIAPPSGLRQAIPGTMLRSYMIPMFGQSWSVFAPEPINGDHRLQVRAEVADGPGQTHTTKWVDATSAELSMLQHHLTPPRGAIQSTELASRYKGDWDDLTPDHKAIVRLGYFDGTDWADRLSAKLTSYGGRKVVKPYLETEHVVTAYATQVAYATWGDDVVRVQFVVSRQNVIPFAERNNPAAQRPGVQVATTGWRGVVEEPGQNRDAFGRTFRQALAESGQ